MNVQATVRKSLRRLCYKTRTDLPSGLGAWKSVNLLAASHILVDVDQIQAIEKARQFARTAYAGQVDEIVRVYQQKIIELRSQLAARGILMSGTQVVETARINAEQLIRHSARWVDGADRVTVSNPVGECRGDKCGVGKDSDRPKEAHV